MTHQELPSYDQAPAGALRFNTDSRKLEVYCGGPVGFGTTTITGAWYQIDSFTPEIATGGTRGIFSGGYDSTHLATQDFVNIDTTGNAQNFGDMTKARGFHACCASRTRGFNAGGTTNPNSATQSDYEILTIASTGSAVAGNSLGSGLAYGTGLSNSTRGIFGCFSTSNDRIDYVTMASLGNAVDFGNLTDSRSEAGSCQSSTRGLFLGGQSGVPVGLGLVNFIDFITISTLGNAADFGDLLTLKEQGGSSSNSVRGLYAGQEQPARTNTIEFVTIATLGNSQDFGDLTQARNQLGGAASPTRGVFFGGVNPSPTPGEMFTTIDYVQIMSTGNAIDFGDLQNDRRRNPPQGISNGHGGL